MAASLIRLPLELIQAIFLSLDHTADVQTLTLTCSRLAAAYGDRRELILNQVLKKELLFDVLPEAVIALKTAQYKTRSKDALCELADELLQYRLDDYDPFAPADVVELSRIHDHVRSLSAAFATDTLAQAPGQNQVENAPPSNKEMARIQRAFYRFEIYCNLFRTENPDSVVYAEQREVFFSHFSPWENEQLACVHEYLAREIMPAFNDVAEHDVDWGAIRVQYGNNVDSGWIQYALSLGLSRHHDIIAADSFASRHKLLCTSGKYYPGFNLEFINEGLRNGANTGGDNTSLEYYTPEDAALRISKPFFEDADPGPESIWRWAHATENQLSFVNNKTEMQLRIWGYVFWGLTRLDALKIMEIPWNPQGDLVQERIEYERLRAEMSFTWERREDIQRQSGSGWWSIGDESQIVWPERVRAAKAREQRLRPKTGPDPPWDFELNQKLRAWDAKVEALATRPRNGNGSLYR